MHSLVAFSPTRQAIPGLSWPRVLLQNRGMEEIGSSRQKKSVVAPETLGDVLYADPSIRVDAEGEWVGLVREVAAHDPLALHALYERAHRLVFTLAVRITGSRETAEEVTVDVFHDVWKRASRYNPANGTVLGWIMNQARSRAIDRVRFEARKKRAEPPACPADLEEGAESRDLLEVKQEGLLLREALAMLTAHERQAIETAYFGELTYAEAAAQLKEPLGTVKTRIRSGLQKLRTALLPQGRAR